MTEEEKRVRRLSYCGTCKTIGSLYGQKARMLLNHDTVFLAELLGRLAGEKPENWEKSYQSFNCFSLPQQDLPFALRFAAATNVVLAGFKLDDHLEDEGGRRYRLARRALAKELEQAEAHLREWRFPLDEVKAMLASQKERENAPAGSAPDATLANLAAPTARATALFFREGARLAGAVDAAEATERLGHAFGELVYLLDAFEDYGKDFRAGQFNALRAAFDLGGPVLAGEAKRRAVALIRRREAEIADALAGLPLGESERAMFAARLAQNLERKLPASLPVVARKNACAPRPRRSFADRWRQAGAQARGLARPFSWQMPLVFAFVFALALVAPAQTREARSARECFDLGFNLMTFGAIFGALLSAPLLAMAKISPGQVAEKIEKKKREGWCDYCDCCDCDCCECCGCCGEGDCGCCGDGCCDCGCDCGS